MNKFFSIIVFAVVFITSTQSLSEGKLTPLVETDNQNNQLSGGVEDNPDSPVLLASNQPITETLYNDKAIIENNSIEEKSECEGTLFGTRWCDNNNGTVTDLSSGLVWLKDAAWGGTYPYWSDSIEGTNAFDRAAQVEPGNPDVLDDNSVKGDWRLPTVSELKALTSGPEAVSTYNMQVFTDVQPDWYWSATIDETGSDSALSVGMHFGNVSNSNKVYYYQIWPVRSVKQ